MRRFFISQHPTFGSFSNPISSKIKKSPYFYWWLALTLNDDYVEYCSNPTLKRFKTNNKIHQIYKDFNDVRYEGCKYKAFTKWWNTKVNNDETKGQYLFAEKTVDSVLLVEDEKTAKGIIKDKSSLLIKIPTNLKKAYIDIGIERILAKHIKFERGRQTRNPTRATARYHLSAPIKVETLQVAFGIYELLLDNKLSSYEVVKKFNIIPKIVYGDKGDIGYARRVVSTKISRKKREAKDAIANVIKGIFP